MTTAASRTWRLALLLPLNFILGFIAMLLAGFWFKYRLLLIDHVWFIGHALVLGRYWTAALWLLNLLVQSVFIWISVAGQLPLSAYMLLIGDYEQALNVATSGNMHQILIQLLKVMPWPQGGNAKLVAFARFNHDLTVKRLTQMKGGTRLVRSQATRKLDLRPGSVAPSESARESDRVCRKKDKKDNALLSCAGRESNLRTLRT